MNNNDDWEIKISPIKRRREELWITQWQLARAIQRDEQIVRNNESYKRKFRHFNIVLDILVALDVIRSNDSTIIAIRHYCNFNK